MVAFFAGEILRIRTKSGVIEPLVFNRAQQHIHEKLEAQLAGLGRVRALILKGRQQGCSTYVGGRYYHRASRAKGVRWAPWPHRLRGGRRRDPRVDSVGERNPAEGRAGGFGTQPERPLLLLTGGIRGVSLMRLWCN